MSRADQDVFDMGVVELVSLQFTTVELGCILLAQAPIGTATKRIPLETASGTCEVTVLVRLPEGPDGS